MSSLVTSTPVNTPQELRAISSLKVGDHVTAYDPATGKASVQTVQQTMVHHDANLLSVTLRTLTPAAPTTSSAAAATSKQQDGAVAAHGAHAPPQASASADETIQTTTNHPWLTADHGWILASFLRLGEPVRRVDGTTAVVVAVQAEPSAAAMWDLTVSTVHTFAVGSGAYVVHNCSNLEPPHPDNLNDAGTSTQSGSRSGNKIEREGSPNSFQRSASGKHIWVYDDTGKVQWDISPERAKYMEWNENPATGERFLRDGPKVPTPRHWLDLFN